MVSTVTQIGNLRTYFIFLFYWRESVLGDRHVNHWKNTHSCWHLLLNVECLIEPLRGVCIRGTQFANSSSTAVVMPKHSIPVVALKSLTARSEGVSRLWASITIDILILRVCFSNWKVTSLRNINLEPFHPHFPIDVLKSYLLAKLSSAHLTTVVPASFGLFKLDTTHNFAYTALCYCSPMCY